MNPLGPHENSIILQTQFETGCSTQSNAVLKRVIELYGNPNLPFEKKATMPNRHYFSGTGVIGCACGGQEDCPNESSSLIR